MAIFRRSRRRETQETENSTTNIEPKEKGSWKRPSNTAFKQQRLKAWQPILTPKTVLPTFLIIGLLFAPIGGLLIWGSGLVTEITLDYTDCENLTPSADNNDLTFTNMSHYNYRLSTSDSKLSFAQPQYAYLTTGAQAQVSSGQCIIRFDIPADLKQSVFLYYKLTNFFQNHRRYVQSMDTDQLIGKYVSPSTLNNGHCKPLALVPQQSGQAQQVYWPCGLIANSIFNDTISNFTSVSSGGDYEFSEQNIAWPGESKKYGSPGYPLSQIAPPPNWSAHFPNGYNSSNLPNLKTDERFQNWMRTAGLPTFTKLYGRNDTATLAAGTYQVQIGLNYPVQPYKGTKSLVISTVSWVGGKNPFLGWAYVATSALFVLLAIVGTVFYVLKPRRLGDMSLLSWNRLN